MKNKSLLFQATGKMAAGMVMVGGVLFLSAGTWNYFGAWLFLVLLFLPMLVLGIVLLAKEPELLAKRLNWKEKERTQSGVVAVSGLMFVAAFVLAGLDCRFGWSRVPWPVVIAAAVIQLLSYGLYAEVMRENAYLSRTIEVQTGQKVIDTGLYGIVRHPMYAATLLMFLAMPLVLGSWVALAVMLIYPIVIVFRILNEEQLLKRELEGYESYMRRVKYRLIPFIW